MKTAASKDSQVRTIIQSNFLPASLMLILLLLFYSSLDGKTSSFPVEVKAQDLQSPNPIPAYQSLFLEDLTWMEVRDAIAAGKSTVIIPTGGIEQSGPYLAIGKHNFILQKTMTLLAQELGNALVAPVVKFVPEGDITPPSGHMKYAGTISVSETVFTLVLVDIARSLAQGGFTDIVILADSGDNLKAMEKACKELDILWKAKPQKIHCVPEYYNYKELTPWLESQGFLQKDEGIHDDLAFTSELLAIDPNLARYEQRKKSNRLSINGIDLSDVARFQSLGNEILRRRAHLASEVIRTRIAETAKNENPKK